MKSEKNSTFDGWLYGTHAVLAYLEAHEKLVKSVAYVKSSHPDMHQIKTRYPNVTFQAVDKTFFNHFPKGHQKIAADAELNMPSSSIEALYELHGHKLCLVALDGVTDPQNLGACIRVARALGASGLLLPKHDSCTLTPLVHKVAAGAAASLPILSITNLHQSLLKLKKLGAWVYGTSEHEHGHALSTIQTDGPIVIVLGSEGQGIRPVIQKTVDHMVAIPTDLDFPSLNVATACGIVLYHFRHIASGSS